MALQPGTTLGPYEILSLIGAGGMGEVYLAREQGLGRRVALKVLPPEFTHDAHRIARFEQEPTTAGWSTAGVDRWLPRWAPARPGSCTRPRRAGCRSRT